VTAGSAHLVTLGQLSDTFRVDSRRWWLLAATALALSACAAAAVQPSLAPVGDGVLLAAGVAAAAVMGQFGSRHDRGPRGWRLLALSPLLVCCGAVLAAAVAPTDPVDVVVLRWAPAVPGYALAIVGGLTLVGRDRLRGRGPRVLVELAILTCASVVAMQMIFLRPGRNWTDLAGPERVVLGAAVLVTAAMMAGGLVVLGAIESRRQRTALLLLGGAVLLGSGRGLITSALLDGWAGGVVTGRLCVVLGLALGALAALCDPGPGANAAPRTGGSERLGQVLPHAAMAAAGVVVGGSLIAGRAPGALTIGGMVVCVALAALHRWIAAREEQLLGARLRRSEAWFRSLVQEGGDALVILDDDLRVSWFSPALGRRLGAAADALVGTPLLAAVHPDDATSLAEVLPRAGEPAAPEPGSAGSLHVLRLKDADGIWRIFEGVVADLRADPSVAAVVLHCRDVTERNAREQVLRDVAYTDPMTGLPNRAGCELALRRAVDVAGPPVTLLLIELDGLPAVREDLGRAVVRDLVSEVGRRLRGTVRAGDLVARMGGGAFAVLAHGESHDPLRDAADVDQLAARCLSVVEQPIMTEGGIVDLTGAIGLARVEPGLSADDVLNRVELAVHAAHVRAAGTAMRWTPAIGEAADRRDRLRTDIAGAAGRGELSLLLEPIVSLTEHRIVGVEAVLRWTHPVLGDVPPSEFVPLAARAGAAGELGRWLLQEAMLAVAALPEHGDPVRLGVDVSTGWASTGTLVADVEAALRMTGLSPERLILEISEATVLADDDRIGLDLATLRLMGVHVALEGFGTGYSGLTQLTSLPIDVLKLDRALVARIDRDPQGRVVSDAMVGIGRALGMDVVAEGVETPAQLASLSDSGYGFAQGRVVSRPMTPADLAAHLSDTAGVLLPGMVVQR
jgi:diguanylate cyclase (GGDEF)-like protein/PAS domain S-box-containing protein